MKKLLSTTAILGALALSAGTAEAANLQVNVGGFIDFQAGYTSDDIIGKGSTASATNDANELNFNNDTEVHFTVEGTADNGLEYGAVIELEADVDNSDLAQNGGLNADKAYLFAQGAWGRVEMGSNTDAAEALSVNSATFASATGGVDGDFYRYAGVPAGGAGFAVRPDLTFANAGAGATSGTNFDEDATKLTYYSPRVAGFQAGVSYAPNLDAVGVTAPSEVGYKNAIAAGLNYTTQVDQFAIKLAGAYETATSKNDTGTVTNGEAIEAWELGGNVSFAGFTVGGSYGDLGNVVASTAGVLEVESADYWDAGVGYAFGPWSASASYFNSTVDQLGAAGNNKFDNIVVGVDYKLAPGLVPYAEVSFFDFDGSTATGSNDGTAVIVGTQLTF